MCGVCESEVNMRRSAFLSGPVDMSRGWVVNVEELDRYTIFSCSLSITQLHEPIEYPELTGNHFNEPKIL